MKKDLKIDKKRITLSIQNIINKQKTRYKSLRVIIRSYYTCRHRLLEIKSNECINLKLESVLFHSIKLFRENPFLIFLLLFVEYFPFLPF